MGTEADRDRREVGDARAPRRMVKTMPGKIRYNKVIELLEQGKPVFSSEIVRNGDLDELMLLAESRYDMAIIEMEHEGLSFPTLRVSLQYLLNRKRIAEKESVQPDVIPMVRVPPNAREQNQWIIKQTLDAGAYGLVVPHVSTVEDARAAAVAARYPQVPGVADFEPAGQRGWWSRSAHRYWGLTTQEYYDAADLWPLDPDGNVLLMGIVEDPEGIRNLREILREVRGIGAIWAGPGDLSVEMGFRGDSRHPEVQASLLQILAACQEFDVPCAVGATVDDVAMRLEQGFRIIMAPPVRDTSALEEGLRLAGRR